MHQKVRVLYLPQKLRIFEKFLFMNIIDIFNFELRCKWFQSDYEQFVYNLFLFSELGSCFLSEPFQHGRYLSICFVNSLISHVLLLLEDVVTYISHVLSTVRLSLFYDNNIYLLKEATKISLVVAKMLFNLVCRSLT